MPGFQRPASNIAIRFIRIHERNVGADNSERDGISKWVCMTFESPAFDAVYLCSRIFHLFSVYGGSLLRVWSPTWATSPIKQRVMWAFLANPEVSTEGLGWIERLFCKYGANCFSQIIGQAPFRHRIIKDARSSLPEAFLPLLHGCESERIGPTLSDKSGRDQFGCELSESQKSNNRPLFHRETECPCRRSWIEFSVHWFSRRRSVRRGGRRKGCATHTWIDHPFLQE